MTIAFLCPWFLTVLLYPQDADYKHFTLQRLADGVYAAVSKNDGSAVSNAGIIDMGGFVIIFDTFLSHDATRDLIRAAGQVSRKPVRFVVNSHYHSDHTWGNQLFGDQTDIISSEHTRRLMQKNRPTDHPDSLKNKISARIKRLSTNLPDTSDHFKYHETLRSLGYYNGLLQSFGNLKIVLPVMTFDSVMTIYGSQRTARVVNTNGGTTGGDVYIYLPDDQIIFTGDLVMTDMHPYLMESKPKDYENTLMDLMNLNIRSVIPGHGPVSDTTAIRDMIRYLQSIDKIVQTKIKSNAKELDTGDISIPAPFNRWYYGDIYAMNIEYIYKLITSR